MNQLNSKICGCPRGTSDTRLVKYITERGWDRKLVFALKQLLVFSDPVKNFLPTQFRSRVELYKKQVSPLRIFSNSYIVRCDQCQFQFIDPLPKEEDLNFYYSNAYFDSKLSEREKAVQESTNAVDPKIKNRSFYQWQLIADFLDQSKIDRSLEFGAGTAQMSYYLKVLNPAIATDIVEPDLSYNQIHAKNLKSQCYKDLADVPTATRFDLITSSHSLEHVLSPIETLKSFKDHLGPKGLLFIEVPNCTNEFFELYRTDAPHISFFTEKSLGEMARKAGLEPLVIQEYGLPFRMYPPPASMSAEELEKPGKEGWTLRGVFKSASN